MTQKYKQIKRRKLGIHMDLHRYLMEEFLKRKLSRFEFVHHKDEDPFNNDIDNLEVISIKKHSQLHNQKYPLTKFCIICGQKFTPSETQRKLQKTCSKKCMYARISLVQRQPNKPHSKYNIKVCPKEYSQVIIFSKNS